MVWYFDLGDLRCALEVELVSEDLEMVRRFLKEFNIINVVFIIKRLYVKMIFCFSR